ncbi:MAG: hypothetical protein R3323_01170 [Wenzhouxiangellaceae bacterium]|nr:hypothetical protein [Wenzhouxiangellaceae bacterium]
MSIMRDDHQASLAGLHSDGSELLQRYRDLLEGQQLSEELRVLLRRVLSEREPLMERLREIDRTRGDLPKAGDPERAFLKSLADWVGDRVLDDSAATAERLADAERDWLDDIEEAMDLDWRDDEREVLAALRDHVRETRARLGELGEG